MSGNTPQIHAEKFEVLIQRRGREVKWEEAILCSCWNLTSGQPDYNCKACKGKGHTYNTPVLGIVLFTSVTANADFQDMAGMFQIGDAVMTVPKRMWLRTATGWDMRTFENVPLYNVGMYDLITLTDDEYKTSEVLIKGEPMYGRPADTLINDTVTAIQVVRKSDPVTGAITDYVPGVDYTNTADTINWLAGGNAPDDGEQYSVIYRHHPVFTVLTTLPKPRHQDGNDLPRYVALRYRAGGFEPK